MNTFFRFFYEFISVFFDGIRKILDGIINGIFGFSAPLYACSRMDFCCTYSITFSSYYSWSIILNMDEIKKILKT